ncbi:MAG: accessory gene regulator ArgB-like protein [Bacillota bacterium]
MMKKQYENTINLWAGAIAKSRPGNREENEAVMAYALHVVFFNLFVAFITILISVLLGVLPAVAAAIIASGSLRIFTGGYHSPSPLVCLILTAGLMNLYGFAAVALAGLLSIYQVILLLFVVMAACLFFISKNAPIETPNKPIRQERRPGLKRKGLVVWLIWVITFCVLSIFNFDYYKEIIIALGLGIANQTFSISGALKNKNE